MNIVDEKKLLLPSADGQGLRPIIIQVMNKQRTDQPSACKYKTLGLDAACGLKRSEQNNERISFGM